MDRDDLVAYGDVSAFPTDGDDKIRRSLTDHDVRRYPEGALIATFAPPPMDSAKTRDPEEIESNPYRREIELTEFPPDSGQFCPW
jgi:hypothetical protein